MSLKLLAPRCRARHFQRTGVSQVGPLTAPSKIMKFDDLTRIESENILAALDHARWKISGKRGAAELLGINPSTLASRMRALGIKRSRAD